MVWHTPICPAAMEALLEVYKQCPLPEAYLNGLAQNNLNGLEHHQPKRRTLCTSRTSSNSSPNCNGVHRVPRYDIAYVRYDIAYVGYDIVYLRYAMYALGPLPTIYARS
ncbi:hypothetical protein BC937DRAFT_91645 [Endogone sp. FLAS-F59071]|nr:hypothetical protein BC937DRAFT_91645 [Endogone sp. FLAS-F59071]|eukprot:RUS16062.1 hypothetical protein BC937DRAFT_91645 [Endogone sp. FLAS-F59071]